MSPSPTLVGSYLLRLELSCRSQVFDWLQLEENECEFFSLSEFKNNS